MSGFVLKALNVKDNERDYSAIMENVAKIQAAAPHLTWPEGLTLEENLIDLAWHQKNLKLAADVAWWWRQCKNNHHESFQKVLFDWLDGAEWPNLDYRKII